MVLKKLNELSANELRTELKRAGITGKYVKSQAIMRLTTHLIDISEDPMTFEFDPEMPITNVIEDTNEYEVVEHETEHTAEISGGSAASVSGLVNSINSVVS